MFLKKSFTLVEVLVAVAIFTIVAVVVSSAITMRMASGNTGSSKTKEITDDLNSVMSVIGQKVVSANVASGSAVATTSSSIRLTYGTTSCASFFLNNNQIKMNQTTPPCSEPVDAPALTSPTVKISAFSVTRPLGGLTNAFKLEIVGEDPVDSNVKVTVHNIFTFK